MKDLARGSMNRFYGATRCSTLAWVYMKIERELRLFMLSQMGIGRVVLKLEKGLELPTTSYIHS